MKNSKKAWLAILLVLIILSAVLLSLIYIRYHDLEHINGLQIIWGDLTIHPSHNDLENIPLTTIKMDNRAEFYGYLVKDLINYYSIKWADISVVYFTARDGSRIVVSKDEIESRDVLLALDYSEFRLVFPQDSFPNRWLKNIILVELK
ncbi:MAG: hypothetical protein K0B81_00120 [Candidatus Cloacimonetes bacterium]|nr:hypothetical protein [Candidatus Cloacimonadota bacterium]